MIHRALREPLVHFVTAGLAIFALSGVFGADVDPGNRIVITGADVERLALLWRETRGREASREELQGLIREHVREEIFYREALALGLDRDDTIIRRRLRQKVEFLIEDLSEPPEPGEAELRAYLQAHPEKFRIPERASFRHVFLSRDRRGAAIDDDAERLLEKLRSENGHLDSNGLGDPFLHGTDLTAMTPRDTDRMFGPGFADQLRTIPAGEWGGPTRSAYGVHLVRVEERMPARLPELDEVRERVHREWRAARRAEAEREAFERLRARYTVVVEEPERVDDGA